VASSPENRQTKDDLSVIEQREIEGSKTTTTKTRSIQSAGVTQIEEPQNGQISSK